MWHVPGLQTNYLGAQKGATLASLISTVSQTLPLETAGAAWLYGNGEHEFNRIKDTNWMSWVAMKELAL